MVNQQLYATIFFSWDFHSFKLGVTSVVDLLLLAITLVFWTNQKDILGQEFFLKKRGRKISN
jgi:hypothetical protein